MIARRLILASLACLSVLAGGVVFSATPALAVRGHEFEKSFGEPCSTTPCGAGQLNDPSGVAVNEATGDVYVVDKGDDRVEWFSASGAYLGQFDGSGLYEVGGLPEVGAGAETGQFEGPEGIAVDNTCALQEQKTGKKLSEEACKALDPSNGDVYVDDAGHEVIDKFEATGAYVGQLKGTPIAGNFGALYGVAVDPKGTVWVYHDMHAINEFDNENVAIFNDLVPNEFVNYFEGLTAGFSKPGFAVGGEENFYLVNTLEGTPGDGPTRVARYSASSIKEKRRVFPSEEEIDDEEVSGVAVEPSNNDVYIDNFGTVGRFSPEGSLIERLEAKGLHGSGVGVSSASETVYVADSSADIVDMWEPAKPSAPEIESEPDSKLTATSANIEAEVNPDGASTSYHFEYGPCATRVSCASSGYGTTVPIPDGMIGSGFDVEGVSESLYDLSPDTAYHFRLVAHNEPKPDHPEETVGREQVFVTQGAGGELVLPDGRQWEMVSSPEKHGSLLKAIEPNEAEGEKSQGLIQASVSGDAVSYVGDAPTELEPQGYSNFVQVLSTRGGNGWVSRDLTVPHEKETGASTEGFEYRFFSEDLSEAVVQPFGPFIPSSSPLALAPKEASEQTAFLHTDFTSGDVSEPCVVSCYRPLVTGMPGYANVPEGTIFGQTNRGATCPPQHSCGPNFVGATTDLDHVVLSSEIPLTSGKPGNKEPQLYEWSAGSLQPVSLLPVGEGGGPAVSPALGADNGGNSMNARNAISEDGRRIFWGTSFGLYMRDMAKKETNVTSGGEWYWPFIFLLGWVPGNYYYLIIILLLLVLLLLLCGVNRVKIIHK